MIRKVLVGLLVVTTSTWGKSIREYEHHLQRAIENANKLLQNVKDPQDVQHTFNNKYDLAEWYSSVALGGIANTMKMLGVEKSDLLAAKALSDSGLQVSLEYEHHLNVQFEKKVERYPVGIIGNLVGEAVREHDYLWKVSASMKISVTTPAEPSNTKTLFEFKSDMQIKTRTEGKPFKGKSILTAIPLSWFLDELSPMGSGLSFNFVVDRSDKNCHTPLNNKQVIQFLYDLECFQSKVQLIRSDAELLIQTEARFSDRYNFDYRGGIMSCDDAVPVVSLVKEVDSSENSSKFSCLDSQDVTVLYNHERECLSKSVDLILDQPVAAKLCTSDCVRIAVAFGHLDALSLGTQAALRWIEMGIRNQLKSAISEDITPQQFQEYMSYHQEELFKDQYKMKKFDSIIRRPRHYPEGTISLPAHVMSKTLTNSSSLLSFKGIDLQLKGTLNLHSWVTYAFRHETTPVKFDARSRQFSGFILLVGTLAAGMCFLLVFVSNLIEVLFLCRPKLNKTITFRKYIHP